MKKFQRMKQQATEALGRGDKTDKLTEKLSMVEKKVERIRSAVQVTTKKLTGTILGSGATLEKHQRKLPQFALGLGMMEHGSQMGQNSLFGSALSLVGQAQVDIASQMANYEVTVAQDVILVLNNMLEDAIKPVERWKKKLGTARLDMDSARTRLRNFEQQIEKSNREYNMEKLASLKLEVDDFSRKFEECQDAYATSMYEFISREQEYTDKIQRLVMLQIANYKNAAVQLEGMLPVFEKRMSESKDRPLFGLLLAEHLRVSKKEIAIVIETCCNELRREWMDTEGLFRIAAGQSKVKFLKTSFDAGQYDVSTHDGHTIAGCLKMYLRELPEPILTFELYEEWMQAAGFADEHIRRENLLEVKDKLPEANINNIKYLCFFLNEFSQYAEITKMTVGNIAIVIGPNLLWPIEDSLDPGRMVTETAMQHRITEIFIEHCNYFFPDLPEPSSSSKSSSISPPLTLTCTSPTTSGGSTSVQSCTRNSNSFAGSSPFSSPHVPSDFSNLLDPPPTKHKPVFPPHPLADSAQEESVTVNVLDNVNSHKLIMRNLSSSSSTGSFRGHKPQPPPRTGSSSSLTPPLSPPSVRRNPPSPIPKARPSLTSSPRGNDASVGGEREKLGSGGVQDDVSSGCGGKSEEHSHQPPVASIRPTPPARSKRSHGVATPPTASKPPPYNTTPSGGSGSNTLDRRGPSRRAPPPPKNKRVDEVTSL